MRIASGSSRHSRHTGRQERARLHDAVSSHGFATLAAFAVRSDRPAGKRARAALNLPHVFSLPSLPSFLLAALLALCVGVAAFAFFAARPVATLSAAEGLYRQEPGAPHRWTSSRVLVPVNGRAGPTELVLTLASGRWPGRAPPELTLASEQGQLASFVVADQPRRYALHLPPGITTLHILTPVERPPQDERWLGVQILGLQAESDGVPANALPDALLAALASIPLTLGLVWAARKAGTRALPYAVVAALLLLAFGLRVALLRDAPPGFTQDEAVSLVDAWSLAQTGRDHMGTPWPLGAFEAFGDWPSPLLTYLQLPFVAVFGPVPLLGRLLTVCLGTLAVAAVYGLARTLSLPPIGAASAALVLALSPWQITMSRHAVPPALVALFWTLCLWSALRFVQADPRPAPGRGQLQLAPYVLALTAGFAIYSYPTMKMAVPLLLALAVLLALFRQGRRSGWREALRVARGWIAPGVLLALLWLPFAIITLVNPVSDRRFAEVVIWAPTRAEWLLRWVESYAVYFRPEFYYITGEPDLVHGPLRGGVQLSAEAPLLVLGLGALLLLLVRPGLWPATAPATHARLASRSTWLLIAGAILIAPLPASLTIPSPYSLRAITITPLYALLVGLGATALAQVTAHIAHAWGRRLVRVGCALLFVLAMAWQCGTWYRGYLSEYPREAAWLFQDGLLETMQRAIDDAPAFDEVWVDLDRTNQPHVYLLLQRPFPAAEVQRLIEVVRRPDQYNVVTQIGPYQFRKFPQLSYNLPTLEAVPNRSGEPGFLLQAWQHEGKQILLLRRALSRAGE